MFMIIYSCDLIQNPDHRIMYLCKIGIYGMHIWFSMNQEVYFDIFVPIINKLHCSDPVCGSDGRNYGNQCEMQEAACKANKSIVEVDAENCDNGKICLTKKLYAFF